MSNPQRYTRVTLEAFMRLQAGSPNILCAGFCQLSNFRDVNGGVQAQEGAQAQALDALRNFSDKQAQLLTQRGLHRGGERRR